MAMQSNYFSSGTELYYSPHPNERPYYDLRFNAPNQSGHVVSTYSNALGLIPDGNALSYPPSQPLPDLHSHSSCQGPHGAVHTDHQNNRSHKRVRFATGWVEHSKYVPHGYIEEVPANDRNTHATGQHLLPANSRRGTRPKYTDPLPPLTTPPPRPELRLRSLPPSPSDGEFAIQQSAVTVQVSGSQEQASELVERAFASANGCIGATDRIYLSFQSTRSSLGLHAHIELCVLIKTSLCSILQALDGRHKISTDEWAGANSSWHQKYADRLVSLDRTLTKYLQLTGAVLLSMIQPDVLLDKLQRYEKRLSELASKIGSSFERLRVQNLHTRLAEVHLAAHQRRISASASDRAWPVEHQASRMRSRRGSTTM